MPGLVDLHHLEQEHVVGAYLLETREGPALFDCGPRTCVDTLVEALAVHGVPLADLRHLLLSHIHLDHAGAAGTLVGRHRRLQVHVSEIGAPHLVDPSRLIASARRVYGGELDRLYGESEPVPQENVHLADRRVVGLDCFPAPGHASHHVCYLDDDGVLYAGDAAGVRIVPGRAIRPHAPPPDVDLDAWERTFAEIEARAPEALALIHFGLVDDVPDHLARTRATLTAWSERIRDGAGEQEWTELAHEELVESEGEAAVELYEHAAPLAQSYAGLTRYWRKRLVESPPPAA
jgi:glyoxylase-like metal-dependent hydrolase (beta-lactamase superfamily II)